ncbi:MAG TPA: HAMP domain-containing sensor histidine kinase [Rhizomicrobium sp.]
MLKAQLDLVVEATQQARLTAPLVALGIGMVASNPINIFGHRPFHIAVILPIAVTILGVIMSYAGGLYRRDMSDELQGERAELWFPGFLFLQVATSAAWGLIPWLLWESGSTLNHAFLSGCVCCVMAELVMSRASNLAFLIATIVPLLALSCARFMLAGTVLDLVIALGLPAMAGYFFTAGRRLTHRLDEESRLRFEVEDLARELEQARDEALRKRFEAETANASKTSFLANMSHELRTPLNAILGFSEMIQKECFGPVGSARYAEYANDIHSSGAHLLSLINDLLDIAKIEAGKMEIAPRALDARHVLKSALRILAVRARERQQELVIQIDPNAPPLYADERAVKQILLNLVSNAVKFTPEGGRITVAASRSAQGDFQVMVEDNGPGITRDKLERVFTPFNQVNNRFDRQGEGTGLGLTLVRGLAELHGGTAWIESDTGKGCRAYVTLPKTQTVRAPAAINA